MHTFKDAKGRTWEISINVATAGRVRAVCGVDIPSLFEDELKPLGRLLADVIGFTAVMYVLCEKQAKELKVDDFDFASALGGDSLDDMVNAFLEEVADFFPRQRGANVRRLVAKAKELVEKSARTMGERVEQIEIDPLVDKWINSSGGVPESSELIRVPSP